MKIRHLLIGMLAIAGAVACKQEEPVEEPKLEVNKTNVAIAATAGEGAFEVTANNAWTAAADADWVSLDPASGNGGEKAATVKVTAEDNTATEARTATVTVKAGALTKTLKVTQAAAQGEQPGPGDEPGTTETYVLVGEAVGGWDVDKNGIILTLKEGYYEAKGVAVTAKKGMHFTKNNKWEGNVKGLHGLIAPNEIGEVGNNDISLTEGGKFDVYLTEALDKFYFMSEGKLPSEAVEHQEISTVWGVCGAIEGNSWGTGSDPDPEMTLEDEWYVAKNINFTEVNFKVRGNNSWADDLKWGTAAKGQTCELNKAVAVSTCTEFKAANPSETDNPNVYIAAPAGAYDVYFSPEKKEVWVMTPGYKPGDEIPAPEEPEQPELQKSEWALVGSFNNWSEKSDLYLSVLDENYFVYYGFDMPAGGEFKFLKGGVWPPDGQEVGGNGLAQPNTIQPAGGSNIKVNEAGKYDIYLAADLSKFYIMSEGKLPSEATEPAPVEKTWGMMGCFVDNTWAKDVPMTKEGEWIVAKGAQFTELTFKIRANESWADATNIGVAPGSAKGEINTKVSVVTAEYAKANLGGDAADIKLNGEAGTYDVYFSYEKLEVYVMTPGLKPGETPAEPEPEYTLDGKQWMAEVEGMQVLFDFGLAEEDMLVVGMPSMDGTGFGLHMAGLYEIVPANGTSGVINFTQYDWEWDEFADPVEIPYSELTATTMKAVSEGVFGTTEPISFTLVENPYEIAPPQTGGENPVGPIENGEYWFFNGEKVMAPLAEGETTGVLPAGNVINGASTEKNIFTLTYDPDWSYYTIQDSYGRYLGQTDETGNITVTDVLPTDETYGLYLWCIEPSYGGAYDIYNAAYYFDLTYSAADNNWVLVDGGYEYPETLPVLVKAENPVEEPVVPQAATIASVLALGNGATIPADTFVEGFVISNMDLNNLTSKKGLYIQDETAGLQFYLAANHTFKFGDKVKVDLSGAKVGEYGGAVQISGLALAKIEVLSSGNAVEPKTVAIADFLANKYEGQYVAVENVQVAKSDLSKTWVSGGAHTSINIEDADGNKFVVFSSKYATYGTSTVSQGAGTLKGIASINNGKIQLVFAQNSDFAGLTGTRFGEEVVEPEEPETPDTPATGNRADFETLTRTSSYTAHTTTAGWVLTNCAVQEGYTTDINPQYILIGKVGDTDTWAKAACMNGKTSAVGTIESPEIAGGCGKLEFDFAHIFSDKNGMDFDIEVIQNGAVVKTINVKKTSSEAAKMTKLHFSEEVNVSGTFKLKFTNNSPSATDSNKDRVSIWNLTWTSVQ